MQDIKTFVSHILPPFVGYLAMVVLAVTRRTRTLQVISWPIVTSLAWRAAVTVTTSLSGSNRKLYNATCVFLMSSIVTRTLDWSLGEAPLVRHLGPMKSCQSTMGDAFDLALTMRGCGWSWSHGVYIPHETRPSGRGGFMLCTVLSAVVHTLMCAVLHRAVLSFSPRGIGTLSGTIFDTTLPYGVRYLRSSVISVLGAFGLYASGQMFYDMCTTVAVLVCAQDPRQWPPAFDAPWRATSLSDFWGRRWHQFFRRMYLIQGGYPLAFFFGRAGLVVGTFLASAMMHHMLLVELDDKSELWRMLVGFGMMIPGVLAEGAFKRWTGRKVGGWAGWIWTMAWLVLWGNVIVDGFARAGVFMHLNFTEGMPGQTMVERLVADVDGWFHAV